jgi:hypothetical protein
LSCSRCVVFFFFFFLFFFFFNVYSFFHRGYRFAVAIR